MDLRSQPYEHGGATTRDDVIKQKEQQKMSLDADSSLYLDFFFLLEQINVFPSRRTREKTARRIAMASERLVHKRSYLSSVDYRVFL